MYVLIINYFTFILIKTISLIKRKFDDDLWKTIEKQKFVNEQKIADLENILQVYICFKAVEQNRNFYFVD